MGEDGLICVGDVNMDTFTSLIENIIDKLKWVLDKELK